jgi:phosphoribosylformylglycinamidine synthase subunit PurQ / glutaminase
MKIGIVVLPGSNCDHDAEHVSRDVLGADTVVLWHKETDLRGVDLVIVPGGFSYGDYLRAGALAKFAPVMASVKQHADRGGLVLGICNGFQILTEAGLLPGALLRNEHLRFVCRNVHLRIEETNLPFTSSLSKGEILTLPIAHGEGNFYADEETLDRIEGNGQVVFRYCDLEGRLTSDANPNGSSRSIAGVCNEKRNVLGLMPHPERCAEGILGNTDGLKLFRSIAESFVRA